MLYHDDDFINLRGYKPMTEYTIHLDWPLFRRQPVRRNQPLLGKYITVYFK